MQHLLRWSLVGLAASALAACGGSKQQQASSPYQQQASSSNQQQATLTPEESASLQEASNQQQQFNQQQQAEKEKAREWYSSSSTCAAKIPQVYISVQDVVDGAKVMYYTTNLAYIDPLRSSVASQFESAGSGEARAAGGTPMSSDMPPVNIKTSRNTDGITVEFTAKDPNHADHVRQLVREDVNNQQRGNCSMLRLPDTTDIDKD